MEASEIKDSKPEILNFVEEHKGELLLSFTEVVKLIGFEDVEDDDYYYVCQSLREGKTLISCVGSLYPLKGKLPDEEYEYLVHFFDMNIEFSLKKQKMEYLNKALEDLKKNGLYVGYVFLDLDIGTVDSQVFDSFEEADEILKMSKSDNDSKRIVPIIDYERDDYR